MQVCERQAGCESCNFGSILAVLAVLCVSVLLSP